VIASLAITTMSRPGFASIGASSSRYSQRLGFKPHQP
jgi:hypothetical protein